MMVMVVVVMPIGRLVMQSIAPVVFRLTAVRIRSMLAGLFRTGSEASNSTSAASTMWGGVQVQIQVIQVIEVAVMVQRWRRVEIVKVRVVLRWRRRRKGVGVVRIGILCTFLNGEEDVERS